MVDLVVLSLHSLKFLLNMSREILDCISGDFPQALGNSSNGRQLLLGHLVPGNGLTMATYLLRVGSLVKLCKQM